MLFTPPRIHLLLGVVEAHSRGHTYYLPDHDVRFQILHSLVWCRKDKGSDVHPSHKPIDTPELVGPGRDKVIMTDH